MNGALHKYPVQHPKLKKQIKFFWEVEADYMQLNHQIIPVRNIDLKFNLSDTPHFLQINGRSRLFEKVYFSGLQDHFLNARIAMRGKVHLLGICFFPEGFYPFLKIPVSECKNQMLGASEAALFKAGTLHERLMEAPDVAARLHMLESELLSTMDHGIQTPVGFPRLLNVLTQYDIPVSLADFCRQNNIGIRKLERMFHRYIGVSAKTYGILHRFQNAMNQLMHSDYSKLSDIAYGNAYFDQMHFIRDFKRFAGNTPKDFIRQKNSMLHVR